MLALDPVGHVDPGTGIPEIEGSGQLLHLTLAVSSQKALPLEASTPRIGGHILRSLYEGSYLFESILGAPDFLETPTWRGGETCTRLTSQAGHLDSRCSVGPPAVAA